jgi:hypothetical protein
MDVVEEAVLDVEPILNSDSDDEIVFDNSD